MSHHNDDQTRYSTGLAAPARGAFATTPRAQSGGENHSAGAPLSNTAPANCMEPDSSSLLRVGVDSLYLSYPGALSDDAAIRLKVLKELAQSREADSQKLAQYAVGDHLFEVNDRGDSLFNIFCKTAGIGLSCLAPMLNARPWPMFNSRVSP